MRTLGFPVDRPAPPHVPADGALVGCRTCGNAILASFDTAPDCRDCASKATS